MVYASKYTLNNRINRQTTFKHRKMVGGAHCPNPILTDFIIKKLFKSVANRDFDTFIDTIGCYFNEYDPAKVDTVNRLKQVLGLLFSDDPFNAGAAAASGRTLAHIAAIRGDVRVLIFLATMYSKLTPDIELYAVSKAQNASSASVTPLTKVLTKYKTFEEFLNKQNTGGLTAFQELYTLGTCDSSGAETHIFKFYTYNDYPRTVIKSYTTLDAEAFTKWTSERNTLNISQVESFFMYYLQTNIIFHDKLKDKVIELYDSRKITNLEAFNRSLLSVSFNYSNSGITSSNSPNYASFKFDSTSLPLPLLTPLPLSLLSKDALTKIGPALAVYPSHTSMPKTFIILPKNVPFIMKDSFSSVLFLPTINKSSTTAPPVKPVIDEIADSMVDQLNVALLYDNSKKITDLAITSKTREPLDPLYEQITTKKDELGLSDQIIDNLQIISLPDNIPIVVQIESSNEVFVLQMSYST